MLPLTRQYVHQGEGTARFGLCPLLAAPGRSAVSVAHEPKTIELEIVYGVNKKVSIAKTATIEELKKKALAAFEIPESESNNFVLRAKIGGNQDEQLLESRTVESYHLHEKQKVTLAAGTPFGSSR
jgi:hypothetical protein